MMAYANMLRRDCLRLEDCLERMDECPLGSGALTSTTIPSRRERVARELGFARITQNSLDGVSDRDFALEMMSALSIMMMHLSRFSEENHPVVLLGIQVHRTGRQLCHRFLHHASEKRIRISPSWYGEKPGGSTVTCSPCSQS